MHSVFLIKIGCDNSCAAAPWKHSAATNAAARTPAATAARGGAEEGMSLRSSLALCYVLCVCRVLSVYQVKDDEAGTRFHRNL
jgi:hypothetical protein